MLTNLVHAIVGYLNTLKADNNSNRSKFSSWILEFCFKASAFKNALIAFYHNFTYIRLASINFVIAKSANNCTIYQFIRCYYLFPHDLS